MGGVPQDYHPILVMVRFGLSAYQGTPGIVCKIVREPLLANHGQGIGKVCSEPIQGGIGAIEAIKV